MSTCYILSSRLAGGDIKINKTQLLKELTVSLGEAEKSILSIQCGKYYDRIEVSTESYGMTEIGHLNNKGIHRAVMFEGNFFKKITRNEETR